MKIKITPGILMDIKAHSKQYLLNRDSICYIDDFQYIQENVIKKRWFASNKTVVEYYLTKLIVIVYDERYETIRTYNDYYIENTFLYFDLTKLRSNWIRLRKQLNAFGIDLVKIKNSKIK